MTGENVLIMGGHVVTVDPALGVLPGADVLVSGGRIAAVGPGLTAPGARVVDARGRLVLPGLVDTHRHTWLGAVAATVGTVSLRGYAAALGPFAARLGPEDVHAGVLWGALQALNAGVTTVADWAHNLRTPAHTDANVLALRDSGVRAVFLHGGPAPAAEVRRVRAEHFGAPGRVTMGLAPGGPHFGPVDDLPAEFALARELGLPVSVHVGMAGFPDGVRDLAALGLLGPDVNHAHASALTDEEYGLVADSGGSIAISPSVDLTMALGVYPATGMARARGIRAGLAADTVASAGTDLFSEMRLALAAERSRANADAVRRGEAVAEVAFDHHDVLRLATLGGAEAWHLDDEIGSLTPGKLADVVVVDLRGPHLDGGGDPVLALLLGAGAADVETVLVGGEIVKEGGRLVGPVVDRARDLMRESRTRVGAPTVS